MSSIRSAAREVIKAWDADGVNNLPLYVTVHELRMALITEREEAKTRQRKRRQRLASCDDCGRADGTHDTGIEH